MMRFYVAGPMSGIAGYNFPAFDAARDMLVAAGHEAISPADLDREHGFDGTKLIAEEDRAAFQRAAMMRDVDAICKVDALWILDGYETSKGTKFEIACAEFLGLTIVYPDHRGRSWYQLQAAKRGHDTFQLPTRP